MSEQRGPQDPIQALDVQIEAARNRYKAAMVQVGEGMLAAQSAQAEAVRLVTLKQEITGEPAQPALFDEQGRPVQVSMGPAIPT